MKLIKQSVVIFILAFFCSCTKKFLDVPDPATLIRQSYVKDINTTTDALDGIYTLLAKNFYYAYTQVYPDLIADNIKLASATTKDLNPQYYWMQLADNSLSRTGSMNIVWLDGYEIISYCNFVAAKAEEYRTENPAKADDIKAQALTLRAFIHFTLVNIFAQAYGFTADASHPGVPYVTNYDWTKPATKRNTVAEVYNGMISDLNQAIPLFATLTTINKLYINRNAAKAILARIYLFKGDFQAAKNLASELSSAVPIMPANATGYPSRLFTQNESEAFFQLSPCQSGITIPVQQGSNITTPISSYTGTYTTTFQSLFFITAKRFIATTDLMTSLNENSSDLRKAWVGPNGDILKYPSDVIPGFSNKPGSYYATLIRSSEMYLTASEAYAQLNNEDSARYYLNQIRTRANIPAITSSVTGAALKDSIYQERRRELCFEGIRMFDLQRWKKGVIRQDGWNAGTMILPYPDNRAIAPIPLTDVMILGLEQNSGY